jgi:hypothetical protein
MRDGAIVAGLLFTAYLFLVVAPQQQTVGFDALSYYLYSIDNPYWLAHGTMGSFVYSPIAARLFQLDALLPFWQFLWLWLALLVGTVLWLGGRRRWLWILAFPPVALELYHGNIHLWIAAAIALGFRYPWTWGFVLLTKVTPGIGLAWFAVRREWRPLAIALGVTGAIAVVSLLYEPNVWREWIDFIGSTPEGGSVAQFQIPIPLWLRLPAAFALVVWGALNDRRWTVPVAATFALPVLWVSGFAICAALASKPLSQRNAVEPDTLPSTVPGPTLA